MIKIKATLKGIPFDLTIDGKTVIYEGLDFETGNKVKEQWFPPLSKRVLANLDKEEYAQWKLAKSEKEVFNLIKLDLMKNECKFNMERL